LLLALVSIPGCFSEQNFPPHYQRLVTVENKDNADTRAWAPRLHAAAKPLLPWGRQDALTTDQLTVNVWKHFDLDPEKLDNIFYNLHGVEQSAQTVSPTPPLRDGHLVRPVWPGFEVVEVPVADGVKLCARIGTPDPRREIPGSWVIFTHGLFGSLDGKDVTNHVEALRQMGHHVLALEMRGHGETFCTYPKCAMTFGLCESGDLLAAARWLKQEHGATRVGLVAFSLIGYEALLTAWLDGKEPASDLPDAKIFAALPKPQPEPAFNAGMFVVSAPVGITQTARDFEPRYTMLEAPVKHSFQQHVIDRIVPNPGGRLYTMWDLAQYELVLSDYRALYPSFADAQPILLKFLDMGANNWQVGAARMENVRVPLLVLNSANDPLGSAQNVADLFSRQHNPNIGVILLREGGHIGFTAFSADYYYSLIKNFFDPKTAPVAHPL
jgi:predicted alpha/beta-fold hydrolase